MSPIVQRALRLDFHGEIRMPRILLLSLTLCLAACDFNFSQVDQVFGEQNFVSAVSIIELHKVRNGEYPVSLDDLEFLGSWDDIWLSAVRYEKAGDGYNLYLERGWAGNPQLEFPVEFKRGLGIRDANVTWTAVSI